MAPRRASHQRLAGTAGSVVGRRLPVDLAAVVVGRMGLAGGAAVGGQPGPGGAPLGPVAVVGAGLADPAALQLPAVQAGVGVAEAVAGERPP